MLATPSIPEFAGTGLPGLSAVGTAFPLRPEFPPLVLVVLTMLVGIFVAAVSVILMYHWRRFPFEHDIFRSAERLYLTGVVVLFGVAVVGILLT